MAERDIGDTGHVAEIRFVPPVMPPADGVDLTTVWTADTIPNKMAYSLVQVPLDKPVEIYYTKPLAELDFSMAPTGDPKEWTVRGDIDSDIVQLLGMPVESPRRGPTPPVIGAGNIEALGKFGEVNVLDEAILEVDLTVPTEKVALLLNNLWQPKQDTGEHKISLKDNGKGFRVLPQKSPPEGKSGARLRVIKPVPKQ